MNRVAVAVLGQLAAELVDEQAAVGEDQDALGARRLDEAGGRDRLARRGRMAEAVAAHRAGVLLDRERLRQLVVELVRRQLELVLRLVVLVGRLLGVVAVRRCRSSSFWVAAISSVSIPASASTWWRRSSVPEAQVRRPLREHALEPEQQRVAHLPLGSTAPCVPASISASASSSARLRAVPGARTTVRVLVGAKERLAGPGFCAEGVGPYGRRALRLCRRMRDGLCQCLRHAYRAASSKDRARVECPSASRNSHNSRSCGRMVHESRSSDRECDVFRGTAWHYARYRPGYPPALIERFARSGRSRPGQPASSISACGTGADRDPDRCLRRRGVASTGAGDARRAPGCGTRQRLACARRDADDVDASIGRPSSWSRSGARCTGSAAIRCSRARAVTRRSRCSATRISTARRSARCSRSRRSSQRSPRRPACASRYESALAGSAFSESRSVGRGRAHVDEGQLVGWAYSTSFASRRAAGRPPRRVRARAAARLKPRYVERVPVERSWDGDRELGRPRGREASPLRAAARRAGRARRSSGAATPPTRPGLALLMAGDPDAAGRGSPCRGALARELGCGAAPRLVGPAGRRAQGGAARGRRRGRRGARALDARARRGRPPHRRSAATRRRSRCSRSAVGRRRGTSPSRCAAATTFRADVADALAFDRRRRPRRARRGGRLGRRVVRDAARLPRGRPRRRHRARPRRPRAPPRDRARAAGVGRRCRPASSRSRPARSRDGTRS